MNLKQARPDRNIIAIGGGGFRDTGQLTSIERSAAEVARRPDGRLRVCYVPTAGGDQKQDVRIFERAWSEISTEVSVLTLFRREVDDIPSLLRAQDLIFVGGGAAANLIELWRLHGVDAAMRSAYRNGVVLAGVSAGAICWHSHGITATFSVSEPASVEGLGLIDATFCRTGRNHPGAAPSRRTCGGSAAPVSAATTTVQSTSSTGSPIASCRTPRACASPNCGSATTARWPRYRFRGGSCARA